MRSRSFYANVLAAALLATACFSSTWAALPSGSEPAVRVGILLFDGVQIIDFAAPYEVFGQARFGVATVSPDGKPVTTAMGLLVNADYGLTNAPDFDVLVVPGGHTGDARRSEGLLAFIRERTARARHVMSVCTGTYLLASAGVLDGLRATTFHGALKDLAASYPRVDVVKDVRWVDNGKVITSAGLSSGIDTSLHVVAQLRGEDVARATALHLEYDWTPSGGFIRTQMADRYMPDLQGVAWPSDIRIDKLISLGDLTSWRERYRITTSTPPSALVQLIEDKLRSRGWTRDDERTERRWRLKMGDKTVRFTLATNPSDDTNVYDLEASLVVESGGRAAGAE